jgi:dihydroorotate dehydrogenase electron transfer subunit
MEILYRVAGRGTEWLSKREKGEFLDILGPFGNGFIIDEGPDPVIIVARGIGIAPLYAVGEAVRKKDKKRKIFILTGARIKERIFYETECKRLGEVLLYTDDGSKGFHGRAPVFLAHLLEKRQLPEKFYLYACGPSQMLKELADLSLRLKFDGQVALEDRMGCGFGACLSCACPLKPREIRKNPQWEKPALQWSEDQSQVYSLICKDGPIYNLNEVDWDEWIA